MQGLPFPAEFAKELDRIEMLHDPERTAALEALNDVIFRTLTRHLFNRARPRTSEADPQHRLLRGNRLGTAPAILRRRTRISRFG